MKFFSFLMKKKPRRYMPRHTASGTQRHRCSTKPANKLTARKIVYLLALCGIILVSHLAHQWLSRSIFFQLTDIAVDGCRNMNRNMVLELSGLTLRTNLFAVDIKTVKNNLEKHDWVETAEVSKKWPNVVAIQIKEAKPVAIINLKEGLYYLDQNATAFAAVTAVDDIDFPVINCAESSIAELNNHTGPKEAIRCAIYFLKQAGGGNPILPCQNISEIAITEDGNLTLYLLDRVFPIYLGKDDTKRQYERLVNILKGLYKNHEILSIDFIDMNYLQDKALVSMSRPVGKNTKG